MFNFFKKHWGLLVVLFLSFWSIRPVLQAGFFPMHDDAQVVRVFEMVKALRDGMLPVRWVSDLGYGFGYPIFNFYAPFAYYVGSFFALIGADSLLATKLSFFIAILISGISMYYFAKSLWGELGGILSAVLYEYATYHAVETYVRGDLGELWAYGLLPLVFLVVLKIAKSKRSFFWTLLGGIAFALVIISHNLTAIMFLPFLLVFALLLIFGSEKKLNVFLKIIFMLLVGIVLSGFYWIPSLFEMNYTNIFSQIGGGADFRDHFVCLQQFWFSNWGYGGSAKGCLDGLSFMIGKIHILLAVFSIAVSFLFVRKFKNKFSLSLYLFFIAGTLISVFFQLQQSQFIWEIIKPMEFFQYPWRFLIMTSFFISLTCGSIFYFSKELVRKKINLVFLFLLIILCVILQQKFFMPQKLFQVNENYYINIDNIFKTSKISDEYMPRGFIKPSSSSVLAENFSQKTQFKSYKFPNASKESVEETLPVAYFPAWTVYVDGKKSNFRVVNSGIEVNIPPGNHNVTARFVQTPVEKTANIISLSGLAVIFLGIIYKLRYYDRKA